MGILVGVLTLFMVAIGTATLSGHPLEMIAAGVVAAGAVLLVTRGRRADHVGQG